jgi:hypothetical protein
MIWESVHRAEGQQRPKQYSLAVLIGTAIGTSIDAMAIGVTLALIKANILVAALAIGGTTFALATLGIMIGRLIGAKLGRIAEAAGGTGADFNRRQDPAGSHPRRLSEPNHAARAGSFLPALAILPPSFLLRKGKCPSDLAADLIVRVAAIGSRLGIGTADIIVPSR